MKWLNREKISISVWTEWLGLTWFDTASVSFSFSTVETDTAHRAECWMVREWLLKWCWIELSCILLAFHIVGTIHGGQERTMSFWRIALLITWLDACLLYLKWSGYFWFLYPVKLHHLSFSCCSIEKQIESLKHHRVLFLNRIQYPSKQGFGSFLNLLLHCYLIELECAGGIKNVERMKESVERREKIPKKKNATLENGVRIVRQWKELKI